MAGVAVVGGASLPIENIKDFFPLEILRISGEGGAGGAAHWAGLGSGLGLGAGGSGIASFLFFSSFSPFSFFFFSFQL